MRTPTKPYGSLLRRLMSPRWRSRRSSVQVWTVGPMEKQWNPRSIPCPHETFLLFECLQLLRSVISDCLPTNLTWICSKVVKTSRRVRWEPMSSTQAAYRPATMGPNGIRNNSEPCRLFPVLLCFRILRRILSRLLRRCIISSHLHVKQVDTVFVVLPHLRTMPYTLVRPCCKRCIVNFHAFALGRTAVHRQPDARQNCMCWFTLRLKFLW